MNEIAVCVITITYAAISGRFLLSGRTRFFLRSFHLVAHVAEKKDGEQIRYGIQIATKLADEIPTMVDIISYMGVKTVEGAPRRILHTPSQGGAFDSKDRTGLVPPYVEVSEKNGWYDLMAAMAEAAASRPAPAPSRPREETPAEPVVPVEEPEPEEEEIPPETTPAVPVPEDVTAALEAQWDEAEKKAASATPSPSPSTPAPASEKTTVGKPASKPAAAPIGKPIERMTADIKANQRHLRDIADKLPEDRREHFYKVADGGNPYKIAASIDTAEGELQAQEIADKYADVLF